MTIARTRNTAPGLGSALGAAARLPVSVLLLSALVFALLAASGDPARRFLGPGAAPQQIAAFRHAYGLDQGLVSRYVSWLSGAARGDLGRSYVSDIPVWTLIRPRLARSAALAVVAWVLTVVVGVPLGLAAGLARRRNAETAFSIVTVAFVAVPEFVVGILLLSLLAVQLHWLPANSSGAGFASTPLHAISSYVLPALTVALAGSVHTLRLMRANARDVASEAYVQAAELRGLTRRRVVFWHVLPNAAAPVAGALGLRFAALLGGVVVAENVFGFPGIGQLLVDSAEAGNAPVVAAVALIVGTGYVLANLAADMAVALIAPRRRLVT